MRQVMIDILSPAHFLPWPSLPLILSESPLTSKLMSFLCWPEGVTASMRPSTSGTMGLLFSWLPSFIFQRKSQSSTPANCCVTFRETLEQRGLPGLCANNVLIFISQTIALCWIEVQVYRWSLAIVMAIKKKCVNNIM